MACKSCDRIGLLVCTLYGAKNQQINLIIIGENKMYWDMSTSKIQMVE
ncbi:MAG: hypothetical protein IPO26_21675 [Saprospiraceae bacterium]|nr:hypothetical protein [Saprospiraceae bacterium]